jgi:hypothetical protein
MAVQTQIPTPYHGPVLRSNVGLYSSLFNQPSIPSTSTSPTVCARRPLAEVVSGWAQHTQRHGSAQNGSGIGPIVTTINRVDRFIGGFPPGRVSLLASQSEFLFNVVARVIVNTVKCTHQDVIYIDGGNSLDPYLLTAACRLFRVEADAVLRRVQVARAFTVFQLDTLIMHSLERILAQHQPRLVLVACMSELYLDRDVNWLEAKTLFDADLANLEQLAERYNVATLLTEFEHDKSIHRFELARKLRNGIAPAYRVSIRHPSQSKLRFVKGTGEFMDYYPLPPYQWTLDDFYPGGDVCG